MSSVGHASILAMGLCSPLGESFAETARRYAEGERGLALERALVGADGLPPTLAQAIPLSKCRDFDARLTQLYDSAVIDCLNQLGRLAAPIPFLRLVVSPTLMTQPWVETFRLSLAERYPALFVDVELVPGGAAEALSELAYATRAVASGETMFAAAGALDSFIHPMILDRLAIDGTILSKGSSSGIVPGEGAGIAVVGGSLDGGAGLGRIRSVFRGSEPEDVSAPKGLVGRGLAEAFTRGAGFAVPDRLIVDLDGQRWRAEEFGFAVTRAGQGEGGIAALAADPEAPALQIGACGSATGLLHAAFALSDAPPRQANGPLAMVSASSRDSGARTVVFIERAAAGEKREAA